jgi:ABC-type transport system involved in cytochrome bd biosynthesis fused ATPase/permease subunit
MQPHPQGDGKGNKSMCVIPIVGIGGLGKTTLAKLVFNDKRMDQLFQLKMCVCVSVDFDINEIIIKIINSVQKIKIIHSTTTSNYSSANSASSTSSLDHQENTKYLNLVQLVSLLRKKLNGKKYLLVLDDIWDDDRAK